MQKQGIDWITTLRKFVDSKQQRTAQEIDDETDQLFLQYIEEARKKVGGVAAVHVFVGARGRPELPEDPEVLPEGGGEREPAELPGAAGGAHAVLAPQDG